MECNFFKILLTDIVYTITNQRLFIFWGGFALMIFGIFGLVLTSSSTNFVVILAFNLMLAGIAMETGTAIFNKLIWGSSDN